MIAPALYYFSASALAISLNIETGQSTFTASETCSVSVASGAAIKVKNSLPLAEQPNKYLTLGYNAQLGYRQFTFIGYNTVFGHPGNKYIASNIYVYIRLDASNNGSTGELIFLPYELDYDGRLMLEEGVSPVIYPTVTIVQRQETIGEETHTYWTLPNDNEDNDSKLKYYYIHIGTISEPVNGARSWLNAIQTGQLETAKGNDEKADTLLEKMFRLSPSNIIQVLLPFDKLSFAASGDLFINRITNQHGADPDLTNDDFGTFTEWIYENTIATTRSIAAYVKSKIRALDQRYFRKDIPDTSPHEATFGDLHVAKNLPQSESEQAAVSNGNLVVDNNATIGGNENVQGDAAVQGTTHVKKKAIFGGNADEHEVKGDDLVAYSIYGAGYGFSFDRAGNGHVRSLVVDESLETKELIVNRLQAQEGDTVYTDNDRIESVRPVVSEVDGSVTYVLTLEEKWEGYFTAQRYGNILKGIINTLAAAYIGALDGGSNSPVTFTAVVSPSGNPSEQGWYEQAESKYLPTTDITVTSGKTYYTVAPKQGYMEEEYNQYLNPRDVGLFERDGSTYYRSTDTTMDPSKTYYREIQGTDDGGNSYFTSWMYVIGDRNTEPGILGLNQIRVALWVDHDSLPLYRNFEPVPKMVIGRCGCFDYSEPIYDDDSPAEKARKEALIKDIKKRQSYFYLSASEGRFMKLTGVSQPLLTEDNYGMVFGNTPDFIRTRSDWENLLREHPHLQDRDYLFAQGLIYSDLIQMNIAGHPVVTVVNCGDWIDGTTAGEAIATEDDSALADENDNVTYYDPGDRIITPKVTKGIYFYRSWNVATGRFETHTVRHKCGTWLCLQDQPVLIDGVKHYFEPTWNSPYWKLIDGDGTLSLGLVSSNGTTFRIGYVDTNIVPTLYYGNSPITDDVSVEYWKWERTIDTSEQRDPAAVQDDARWNAQHQHVKTLHLTSADMPLDWSFAHRAKFTCFVIVDDGKSQELVTQQMTF